MKLELKRIIYSDNSTLGELFVDGEFLMFSLEDVVRVFKIIGRSAIPAGTYQIDITYSARFERYMPLIQNVNGFTGIRIHAGNTAEDTEGCILVGLSKSRDFIKDSRKAMTAIWKLMLDQMADCFKKGKPITITITDTQNPRIF